MANEQSHNVAPGSAATEIDRIRDIIFGRQMQEYEQGFQSLRQELARLEEEIGQLRQQLIEQEQAQSQKLQQVQTELQQADEALRAELQATAHTLMTEKVDRSVLGEWLIQIGSQLKAGGVPAEPPAQSGDDATEQRSRYDDG